METVTETLNKVPDVTDHIHPQSDDRIMSVLVAKVDELIEVTNRQNDMLSLIVDEVGPTLEALKSSPLGMFLGGNGS